MRIKKGHVIERFIGIEHVASTTALSLETNIDSLFSKHGLSMSKLSGQGYDGGHGASYMYGEFNSLKTFVVKDNECAFYVHCFAHQLRLAIVVVAKNHIQLTSLFRVVTNVVNVVGGSFKYRDILHDKQVAMVVESLKHGELSSGQGLNQETNQLKLTLVVVVKNHIQIASLLSVVTNVVNVVSASSKRRNILHDKQVAMVIEFLKHGELSSGQGLNQETTLKHACETR